MTGSSRLQASIDRFTDLWVPALAKSFVRRTVIAMDETAKAATRTDVLHTLELDVESTDETLGLDTDYSYTLDVSGKTSLLSARHATPPRIPAGHLQLDLLRNTQHATLPRLFCCANH